MNDVNLNTEEVGKGVIMPFMERICDKEKQEM